MALWESQLAQLGLAVASCVARCGQLPECAAQGNQQSSHSLLFASGSLWKTERVHDPEQTLRLGLTGGFPEGQRSPKAHVKSCVFACCSGGGSWESVAFIIFSKKALFQKWLKTRVGPSLFPISSTFGLGFPAHNVRGSPTTQAPISQSLDRRGEEWGRGPGCFGLLGEVHEDTGGGRGTVPQGDGHWLPRP